MHKRNPSSWSPCKQQASTQSLPGSSNVKASALLDLPGGGSAAEDGQRAVLVTVRGVKSRLARQNSLRVRLAASRSLEDFEAKAKCGAGYGTRKKVRMPP